MSKVRLDGFKFNIFLNLSKFYFLLHGSSSNITLMELNSLDRFKIVIQLYRKREVKIIAQVISYKIGINNI